MKLFTEFIIYHEDISMPNERKICSSLWETESFDSDGDYYYDNIDNRWTQLEIESQIASSEYSKLIVYVYRENNRFYDPSIIDIKQLRKYIEFKEKGHYEYNSIVSNIQNPAIASFRFETCSQKHYDEFLKSVYSFLIYSKGSVINYKELEAQQFYEEFLK